MPSPQGVPVATLLRDLAETRGIDLELVAGAGGVERRITYPHPQKTGLALTGFDKYLREGRVLVFGESEVRYLESLAPAERIAVISRVYSHAIPCLVITAGFQPPPELASEADRANLPLMKTRAATPLVMARLSAALDVYLAPHTVLHGVARGLRRMGRRRRVRGRAAQRDVRRGQRKRQARSSEREGSLRLHRKWGSVPDRAIDAPARQRGKPARWGDVVQFCVSSR